MLATETVAVDVPLRIRVLELARVEAGLVLDDHAVSEICLVGGGGRTEKAERASSRRKKRQDIPDLGEDDKLFPRNVQLLDGLADDTLRVPVRVDVGGAARPQQLSEKPSCKRGEENRGRVLTPRC